MSTCSMTLILFSRFVMAIQSSDSFGAFLSQSKVLDLTITDCRQSPVQKRSGQYNRFNPHHQHIATIPDQSIYINCNSINDGEPSKLIPLRDELKKKVQSGKVHLLGSVDEGHTDFSREKLSNMAAGEFNWRLEGAWKHNEEGSHFIYMFHQSDTNNIQWFVMEQEGRTRKSGSLGFYHIPIMDEGKRISLGFHHDIKSAVEYQCKINREISTLQSKLDESDKLNEDYQSKIHLLECELADQREMVSHQKEQIFEQKKQISSMESELNCNSYADATFGFVGGFIMATIIGLCVYFSDKKFEKLCVYLRSKKCWEWVDSNELGTCRKERLSTIQEESERMDSASDEVDDTEIVVHESLGERRVQNKGLWAEISINKQRLPVKYENEEKL